jgi:hypothetical protein
MPSKFHSQGDRYKLSNDFISLDIHFFTDNNCHIDRKLMYY